MSEIANDFKKDKNKYLKDKAIILEKLVDIYSKGFNNWFKTWPLRHDFINALFYKNIILCEGLNDEYFLNYLSLETNIFILKSFGKFEIPFLKLVLFLFNKKIYVVYDNDISRKNDTENQKRNQFWVAINSIVKNNYSICRENSYSFDFNLEYAVKIDLNNNLKNYMSRMNLFINNKDQENLQKIQKELTESIEYFFNENGQVGKDLDSINEHIELKNKLNLN